MRAVRLVDVRQLEYVEVPIPQPPAGWVRIKVMAVGLCGSDQHAFSGEHPFVKPPIILGHEVGGVVDAVGENVSSVQVGQHVTFEPQVPCWHCTNCLQGRYNICDNLRVIGCVGYDGGYADYVVVPERSVFPVPEDWTFGRAAMLEPAAVAVHAVDVGQVRPGTRVIVIGGGTIGLLVAQVATCAGASHLVVIEPMESRARFAEEMGVGFVISAVGEPATEKALSVLGSGRFDVVFDCVANEMTLSQSLELVNKGGRIVVVGVPAGVVATNFAYIQDREIQVAGTLMYTRTDFIRTARMIERHQIDVDRLVTHRFPLSEAHRAFEAASRGVGVMKVQLIPMP
ncbi:MAG: zinc-dependent alcohol dehydrogenase [Clostridia bacterium]